MLLHSVLFFICSYMKFQNTLLHISIIKGHTQVVSMLLEHSGINIEARDKVCLGMQDIVGVASTMYNIHVPQQTHPDICVLYMYVWNICLFIICHIHVPGP